MNNMEEEIMQEELSPEEAKASLGLSTRLSEQMLMMEAQQMGMEGSDEPQEPQGEEFDEETEEVSPEPKEANSEAIKAEVKKAVEAELGPIKEALEKALNETEEN